MRPSEALEKRRVQVLQILARFGLENPRVFGSVARGADTEASDIDILVDAPAYTSLYDLAAVEVELEALLECKVDVVTKGFLAPDILTRAYADLIFMS